MDKSKKYCLKAKDNITEIGKQINTNFLRQDKMNAQKFKIRSYILLALVFWAFYTWSQKDKAGTFLFQGVVYGYNHDPSMKLLKKSKQFVIEGLLNGASINVYDYDNDKLIYKDKTNKNGEFKVTLPLNRIFKFELSKENYDKNILLIDTRIPIEKTGQSIAFTGAEFMLNSFKTKDESIPEAMGRLYYDEHKASIEFRMNFEKSKKIENSVDLLRKAVLKNKKSPFVKSPLASASAKDTFAEKVQEKIPKTPTAQLKIFPAGIENITEENIVLRKNEIEKAKTQIKEDKLYAMSKEDSLIIVANETILRAAEVELQNAQKLIEVQKSEIHHKKRELYITLTLLLLLTSCSVVLYIYYRDKKRTNQLLEIQNSNILDSITYAKCIQQSILIDEEEIKKILPDFFIYYQPKDIVSGDFYWFSQIADKVFIAVVDCTGHGVPGAFMSLIANTLLNKIVNEKGISDPAHILKHLHNDITESLQQEKDNNRSYDGMDMALCVIDKSKNKIKYAGAINPLYIVHEGNVDVIKADMQPIGGRKLRGAADNSRKFTTHTITIKTGMSLYMFSDGYVDQFGEVIRKKFSTERFRALLLDIQVHDMSRQKEIIQNTMDEWKGSFKQIDDMLVVGMKI